MEIANFWIHKDNRGKGLGGQILEQAEKRGKTLGAKKALLTTFDFQARRFYEGKAIKSLVKLRIILQEAVIIRWKKIILTSLNSMPVPLTGTGSFY